jgi:hypothetical protein
VRQVFLDLLDFGAEIFDQTHLEWQDSEVIARLKVKHVFRRWPQAERCSYPDRFRFVITVELQALFHCLAD